MYLKIALAVISKLDCWSEAPFKLVEASTW